MSWEDSDLNLTETLSRNLPGGNERNHENPQSLQPSQGRYLNTGQQKHGINIYTYQISMPCVGSEPTIPASERAKTMHALDCSATGTENYRDKFTVINVPIYFLILRCSDEERGLYSSPHTRSVYCR
jgi:hypothetical protein